MNTCFDKDRGTEVGARKFRADHGERRAPPRAEKRVGRLRQAQAVATQPDRARPAPHAPQDWAWVCRIAERVVGAIGVAPDGLDGLCIRLFRIDPEWQHTSVPKKLIECVRNHAERCGRSRIVVEPRVVPRWLLQSLGRYGFHFEGWRSVCDREVLEFSLACEPRPVARSEQRLAVRLRKRRPHWSTRCAHSVSVGDGDGP